MINLPEYIKIALEKLKNYDTYLVGGCVRDFLLGKNPDDYDLCTSALPSEIIECFSEHKTVLTGVKHGTVMVVVCGKPVEITTFRTEKEYNDHRRPNGVCFVKDINEDLARRDFTINAIAYHPNKGFVDPFGGTEDLEKKIIKTVGEPSKRFSEDALRVLRAVRFSATLGFEIEEKTQIELNNYAKELDFVAKERQLSEISKLFLADSSEKISRVILENKSVFFNVFPSLISCETCKQETKYHKYTVLEHTLKSLSNIYDTQNRTEDDKIATRNLRLAMLLHDTGKPKAKYFGDDKVVHFHGHAKISMNLAKKDLENLKIDKKSLEYILKLIELHGQNIPREKPEVLKFWSEYGLEFTLDLINVQICDLLGKSEYSMERDYVNLTNLKLIHEQIKKTSPCYTLNDLKCTGEDIKSLGYQGKKIGEVLEFLLSAVMKDNVNNEKEKLVKYVKKFFI